MRSAHYHGREGKTKSWGDVLALQAIAGQLSPGVPGPLFPVVAKLPWLSRPRQGKCPRRFHRFAPACSAGAKLTPRPESNLAQRLPILARVMIFASAARRPALRCWDRCSSFPSLRFDRRERGKLMCWGQHHSWGKVRWILQLVMPPHHGVSLRPVCWPGTKGNGENPSPERGAGPAQRRQGA
jgi:hypothetical protein